MKPLPSRKASASVMVFALLIILVGSLVLAAWVQTLATRATFSENALLGQKRRIALANGRALLRQYVLNNMPSGGVSATTYSLADDWGGFSVSASAGGLLTTRNGPSVINPFSPLEREGFGSTITANVTDGDQTYDWSVRVRTRSPVYGGFPLTIQNSASAISSGLTVTGSALDWPSSGSISPTTTGYQAPGPRTSLQAGGGVLSGFPWVPLTSGTVSGVNSYGGYISLTPITTNQVTDDSSTAADGIVITDVGTARTIQIDLSTVNLTTAPGTDNAMMHFQVPPSAPGIATVTLRLIGTATSYLPALHVYFVDAGGNNLTRVELQGATNNRLVYLSVIKSTSLILASSTGGTWRLGACFQGCATDWQVSAAMNLTGGIRTNANLTISSGSVRISPDASPSGLAVMADRVMWLEDNRTP